MTHQTTERAYPDEAERDQVLATGRRVLSLEGQALVEFSQTLGANFVDAVDLMLNAPGRVIVSGMGKSGHVGRKIAATLASTGTPAQFVHPAEASHGDLGMITAQDIALVLSNSGETRELADIIAHTRRFKIPLIGVASRPGSTLLSQSDVALTLPQAIEAGSVGLAPTTSTTLTIALGDALAVALMERRDFTPESFRDFHPGGTLGAQLVPVAALMSTGDAIPLVAATAPMSEALLVMSEKGFGVAGTLSGDGTLAGIITDGDLRRNMEGLLTRRAGDVATANPRTIGPAILAQEAVAEMTSRDPRVTTLFVLDPDGSGRPIGILHLHDCLRAGVDMGPDIR
ncbi:MAG: KpsF/GutQ family sugar-phosphate isomerase [Pseudomonadota bacterium]